MKKHNNKNNKKNKKGFSLVELLGVIVIFGILATIASAAIIRYVKMSKDKYEDTQVHFIKVAAKEYLSGHKKMPKVSGRSVCVPINTLISEGYLSAIKDTSSKTCVFKTYSDDKCNKGDLDTVYVTKVNNKEYSYDAIFSKCFKDSSEDKDITYTLQYNANGGTGAPSSKVIKGEKTITLSTQIPKRKGYKFLGWSTSKVASSAKWKSGATYNVNSNVTLYAVWSNVEFNVKINNPSEGKWTSSDVTITCTATATSEISKWQVSTDDVNWTDIPSSNKFSIEQSFTSDIEETYYYRACEDNTTCSSSVSTTIKIDKTAPTKPSLINSFGDKWMNKISYDKTDYYLDCSTVENGSGIDYWSYSYDNNNFIIYDNSNKSNFKTTPFTKERNQYVYIKACDKVGNCSESEKNFIKIDKTAPTTPSLINSFGDKWMNKKSYDKTAYYLDCSTVENGSGIDYWAYAYKDKDYTTYADSSNTSFKTTPFTKERNEYVYIKACDKAGNCSDSKENHIRIDITPPTVSYRKVDKSERPYCDDRCNFGLMITGSDKGSGFKGFKHVKVESCSQCCKNGSYPYYAKDDGTGREGTKWWAGTAQNWMRIVQFQIYDYAGNCKNYVNQPWYNSSFQQVNCAFGTTAAYATINENTECSW